jgi:hypothetical protein
MRAARLVPDMGARCGELVIGIPCKERTIGSGQG